MRYRRTYVLNNNSIIFADCTNICLDGRATVVEENGYPDDFCEYPEESVQEDLNGAASSGVQVILTIFSNKRVS